MDKYKHQNLNLRLSYKPVVIFFLENLVIFRHQTRIWEKRATIVIPTSPFTILGYIFL